MLQLGFQRLFSRFSSRFSSHIMALLVLVGLSINAVWAFDPGTIRWDQLPPEARTTVQLIQQGGPFPYERDGIVFGNRERLLPKKARGYYTEYTVKTPGSRDRGARRVVAGAGAGGNPATSGEYYYSDDHYASFKRIELAPARPR